MNFVICNNYYKLFSLKWKSQFIFEKCLSNSQIWIAMVCKSFSYIKNTVLGRKGASSVRVQTTAQMVFLETSLSSIYAKVLSICSMWIQTEHQATWWDLIQLIIFTTDILRWKWLFLFLVVNGLEVKNAIWCQCLDLCWGTSHFPQMLPTI